MTIARTWSGSVPADQGDAFHEHLLATGVAEAEATHGFQDATVLRRDEKDRAHFTLITYWADVAASHRFADADDDTARLYPGDERFGLEPDSEVNHHRVVRSQTLGEVRRAYVRAAQTSASLLAHPAIAAAWDEPSAVKLHSVAGLAGHLAGQIFFAEKAIAWAEPEDDPISLADYYDRVDWIKEGPDSPTHRRIRQGSAQAAEDGPAALAARVEAAVARLPQLLTETPTLRRVRLPTWQWALTLDDFLRTRLVELAVHLDDLAVSVGVATPRLPTEITDPVIDLLTRLAVRKHGPTPVLRALCRAERAPATIAAF
ncbi:heme-degrading monooxygenase HmoA [Hamadaea flava]|uniref:Antibiotic biosynthesis monooxygenase family protein n=1 Tax=Hamadaea flava TaxID=1742688 RepID=A0ABV8LL90_9ACTN|nr:maleylpyruvate isomerase N-terminal domain-containing protein [Hamadaea flava]MCP2324202.1 heme-degrading monooxygenase HmoA [Hamadaea flava]